MTHRDGLNKILGLPLKLLENLPRSAEKEVSEAIRALKTEGNLADRVAAANTLGDLALKDRLGYRGRHLACDALLDVLAHSREDELAPLREAIITALSPDCKPGLFADDPRVNKALVMFLRVRDEGVVHQPRVETNQKVRECAARGLAFCHDPNALKVLLRASEDDDPVGHAAANSLKLTLSNTREPEVVKFGFEMAKEMMERPGSDPYILRLADILAYAQDPSLAHRPISLINRPLERQIIAHVIHSCLGSCNRTRERLEQVGQFTEDGDELINRFGRLYFEVAYLVGRLDSRTRADGTKAPLNLDENVLMMTAQTALEEIKERLGPQRIEAMTRANEEISYSGNLPPIPSL